MDLPNWLSLERVGRPDFKAATGALVLLDQLRHNRTLVLPTGRATGETNYDPRIISGFNWTTALVGAGLTRVLNRGKGLFPYRDTDDGQVKHMILFADEGLETISVDFSTATDPSVQDVYVRLVRTPAAFANRVFWNPSGAPAQEHVSNVATRLQVAWEVAFQDSGLPSPGTEWVKIWEVTISGGAITAGEDFRHFFFEGSANSTDAYGPEWGDGANDRDSDRALYGINDLHIILQAFRRQFADIIGYPQGGPIHDWWRLPPIELESLAVEHYAESDGALAGLHKTVTVGDGVNQTVQQTASLDYCLWEFLDDPSNALAFALQSIAAGQTKASLAPRGTSAPMSNGDVLTVELGDLSGADVQLEAMRTLANSHSLTIQAAGGSNGMTVYMGAGAIVRGALLVEADAAYYVNQRSIYVNLPWSGIVPDDAGARSWEMSGPADGDVTGGNVTLRSIGTINGNLPLFLEFNDFPDEATLLAIDVTWSQGSTGAANEMRMYASRHTNTFSAPTDSHDASTDESFDWAEQSLNSVQDFVEYALNVQPIQTRRFKPNQNASGWDRRRHKLVIAIKPPDTVAAQLTVYQVRTRWAYSNASPWPRRADFT